MLPVGVDDDCLGLDALPEGGEATLVLRGRQHGLHVRDEERRDADVLEADHRRVSLSCRLSTRKELRCTC